MEIGTKVKIVNCFEARKDPNKVWVTRSEPWELGHGQKVVLLEGKPGGFSVDCLEVVNEMKVFRLNEYDWVYAENFEQALGWYMNQTGLEKDEAYDEHYFEEIDPNKGTTLVHIDELPLEEQKMTQQIIRQGNNLWVRKTYAQVVESENLAAPCIIASTEY